jgi:glycosyltransferase involved in cell wall biosynthesis
MEELHHITVSLCTYQRPELLGRLLEALERQQTGGLFTYSVSVVDNDRHRSGRAAVEAAAAKRIVQVTYDVEPEQNIALARNRAVRNARGTHIAFLDDDERPIETWLLLLYRTCRSQAAHGVLGPVKPEFPQTPPPWIIQGRICERKSYKTGTVIRRHSDARTGNVLFDRRIFASEPQPFDPRFGRTGGEDVDFFRRMMEKGYVFVWCNEAEAYETVPPERMTRSYHLRRALLRGMVVFRRSTPALKVLGIAKSLAAVAVYTPLLAVLAFTPGLFMRYLIKCCDHLGKLMAAAGLTVIRERGGDTIVQPGTARPDEAVRE